MISMPLFVRESRAGWKMLLVFLAILAVYGSMVVALYDPETSASLAEIAEAMPDVFAAFGMAEMSTDLTEFLANYLYNFLFVALPLVFIILTAVRLVARYVDRGSMAYLLATPNTRLRIVTTQALYLCGCLVLMVGFVAVLCIVSAEGMFPGKLETGRFWVLNAGLLGLLLFLAGVCFCASCLCNSASLATGIGGGLCIVFVLLQMLANVGDKFNFLRYATPLTLYDVGGIVAGKAGAFAGAALLYGAALVLFLAGGIGFCRRDLPL